jgi:hypothetical protein
MQVFDNFSLITLIISLSNSCAKAGHAESLPLIKKIFTVHSGRLEFHSLPKN